ncbi:MAG: CYTH domain-containing protein [Eubacterium sp.]|nr:CYTH domain-containing protein [Candidatus Colimonas fimequi]
MEIELKFDIPSEEIADAIWQNELFKAYEEEESREEMCLDARYYDTAEYALSKQMIAYRVRKEGERLVAALKWKGTNEGALHSREELCVPVFDSTPDVSIFAQSDIGDELMAITGGKELGCIIKTQVHRKSFRIDTGTGIFEFSIDSGKIITPFGEEPIHEVEVELFTGETDELVTIGDKLAEKYNLVTAERSKYARGIDMIRNGK